MIAQALANILNPTCLALICMGVIVGIIFGSIPGLSATMAVVLFLPLSFGLEPANGISLLIGLYIRGIDFCDFAKNPWYAVFHCYRFRWRPDGR